MTVPVRPCDADAEPTSLVEALGQRSIVLVGMMGAGKSTIGRRLAARLQLPFVDADREIEAAHAGMTIPEIFASHGEAYFRDGEARVLARLLENGPQVLATGGGAIMRDETRQRIAERGISIWLRASADTILRRVKKRGGRPLLQNDDPAATIARLLELREPVYGLADITIESRDVAQETIVNECLAALAGTLPAPAAPVNESVK